MTPEQEAARAIEVDHVHGKRCDYIVHPSLDLRKLRSALLDIAVAKVAPDVAFVHPTVYNQRAECPLWTNDPNPEHTHDRRCSGA